MARKVRGAGGSPSQHTGPDAGVDRKPVSGGSLLGVHIWELSQSAGAASQVPQTTDRAASTTETHVSHSGGWTSKTQVPAGWAVARPPSWLADDLFSACVLSWCLSLCEATVLLEQGPQ